jgi:hypothetical protein
MPKTDSPRIETRTRRVTPAFHDPTPWLERTEALIDSYRGRLHAHAPGVDPGLTYLWLAADHLFERHGGHADFALLDVARLLEPAAGLAANKRVQLLLALTTFYGFLGDSRAIAPERAAAIRVDLAEALDVLTCLPNAPPKGPFADS